MKRFSSLLIYICCMIAAASAATLNDVQRMIDTGDYAKAVAAADSIVKAQPKSGDAMYMLGRALLAAERTAEAEARFKEARAMGAHESILALAEIATNRYEIDRAEQLIADYKAFLAKNKKKKFSDNSEPVVERMNEISTLLDRVEKIQVIDSLIVDKRDFFEAYRLSHESGSLNPTGILPAGFPFAQPTTVYLTEDGREMLWAAKDPVSGKTTLQATNYLADGTWEDPTPVGEHLGDGGNANYPFLMADGITLYFASDCEQSLGGYDIFIARNNGTEFLQPQNLGLPYNSPYDDYMLAIDEMNGVGWWATDRNRIPGKLTIYLFIPSDLRINVDRSDPTLADRARINSIRTTWTPGTDYAPLLERVQAIIPPSAAATPQFHFTLPDGRELTRYSQFTNLQAREAMGRHVELTAEIADLKQQLEKLRLQYAKGDTSLEMEILYLERDLLNAQTDLTRVANDIIRAEIR